MAQPAVTAPREAWQRVAAAIVTRRHELGLTQDDLGVSKAVASALENAKQTSFARSSLVKVATALSWTSDSIQRILDGGDPTIVVDGRVSLGTVAELKASGNSGTDGTAELTPAIEERLRRLVQDQIDEAAELLRLEFAPTIAMTIEEVDPAEYAAFMIQELGPEVAGEVADELRVQIERISQRRLRLAAKGGNLRGAGRVVGRPQPPAESD